MSPLLDELGHRHHDVSGGRLASLSPLERDDSPPAGKTEGFCDGSRDRIGGRTQGFRVLVDVALGDGALLVAVAEEWGDEGGVAAVVNVGAHAGKGVAQGVEVAAALEG